MRLFLCLLFCLAVFPAKAQNPVSQSGTVTPGHAVCWTTDGTVQDCGQATNSFLTSLGVTAQGNGICQNSGPVTGPFNQICLGATGTGGTVSWTNFAGATGQLSANINGISYPFPFTTGGIVGPGSTTVGHMACWNNTSGTLLKDCSFRTIFVGDFGAVCDEATNDTSAIQNAINAGISSEKSVRFYGGCVVTNLTATAAVDFGGSEPTNAALESPSGSGVQFTINSNDPVFLHDYQCVTQSTPSPGDTCILVTAPTENDFSLFWGLDLENYIPIDFEKAAAWRLWSSRMVVAATGGTGVIVKNTNLGDSGDSTIFGSEVDCAGGIGVEWESSGGFRFNNNKINGSSCTVDIRINLATGVTTGAILIQDNSLEGLSSFSAPCITLQRQGSTGQLVGVMIENNECALGGALLNIPLDGTGAWMNGLVVTGNFLNTFQGSGTVIGIKLADVGGALVANNVLILGGTSNQPIQTNSSTFTTCTIGPNQPVNNNVGSTVGTCTAISPN
jgi:hypothetical protein